MTTHSWFGSAFPTLEDAIVDYEYPQWSEFGDMPRFESERHSFHMRNSQDSFVPCCNPECRGGGYRFNHIQRNRGGPWNSETGLR